jgi:hypothetical protein
MPRTASTPQARSAASFAIALCLIFLAVLGFILWTHYPDNHIGLDIRIGYLIAGLSVAAAPAARFGGGLSRRMTGVTLAAGAVLAVSVFVCDHWNLVVGYELWLERGQPAFGARAAP